MVVVLQVLQANVGKLSSRDLADELKQVYAASVRVNPRLLRVGVSERHITNGASLNFGSKGPQLLPSVTAQVTKGLLRFVNPFTENVCSQFH